MKTFLIFLGLAIVIIFPQFFVKSFALIDDGTDYLFVRNNSYVEILKDQLFNNERTRPLKFIIKKICLEFFNLNVAGYFVVEAVLLAVCSYLMYLILNGLSKNLEMVIVGTMLFMLSPPVVANFYRLGTDEGWQLGCLLLALYMWMLKKDKKFLGLMIINLFIKETSIFFMLLPVWYFWKEKKWKLLGISLLASIIFSGLVIYKLFEPGSVYINQVRLSESLLMANFIQFCEYFGAILLVGGGLLCQITESPKPKKRKIMFFLGVVTASIPLFIWRIYNEYYLLVLFALMVICVVDISKCWSRRWQIAIIILGIFIIIINLPRSIFLAKLWHEKYIVEGALSGYLTKSNLSDWTIFSNELGLEENIKIYVYINEWSGRCKTFFPPIKQWRETFIDINGANIRNRLANESVENFLKSNDIKKMLISEGKRGDMSNYGEEAICGFSFFSGNICNYYIYR